MTLIQTVTGAISPEGLSVVDAHNHVWIAPDDRLPPDMPRLCDQAAIQAELSDYRQAGGTAIVDCQPGGCGRDGRVLARLAHASGVYLVACTGFHLRKYYPPHYWLWQASAEQTARLFVNEISCGLAETLDSQQPVRAGFIKIACQARLEDTSPGLLEAATVASLQTGSPLMAHTERGLDAERLLARLVGWGLPAGRLALAHMDKRPDPGLHRALADAGVLLIYDTFYRPKYDPEHNVWPLLEHMLSAGYERRIAIGTDMADGSFWRRLGGSPGLIGLFSSIRPRLQRIGLSPEVVSRLLGGNVAHWLAGLEA